MLSLTRIRKTTALLLLAVMAMLPLQGLQAALETLEHHAGDTHSPREHLEHVMVDSTSIHTCQMHDHGDHAKHLDKDKQHCSSNGCDMCGTCFADLPKAFVFVINHDRFLPEPVEHRQSFINDNPLLYRPPRA